MNPLLPADIVSSLFNDGMIIPIVAMVIPFVAILTSHQRKMAQMMAEQQRAFLELENRRLGAMPAPVDPATQYELQTLRDRLARMETELAESRADAQGRDENRA